jgi:glyoxalase family protein
MRFEGIHHITCITGDAPGNVDFYVRVLGLRLVKKSVNQDDPTVYHLFYSDEKGSAGSDLTFFEYPHASPGRAGRGMVHRIVFRVASEDAIEFWNDRLTSEGIPVDRNEGSLRFADPEGLDLELSVVETNDEPLEHLGEKLSLPPDYEHLRERVEPVLTPLPNPRELVQR